jgi:molybdopterin-binding protein
MKISARNLLKGKVKSVRHGDVNCEVVIEVAPGIDVVSVITESSAKNLGLAVGKDAYAVIKASSVMVATD